MAIKRFNIVNLLNNGGRDIAWRIIINYRYIFDDITENQKAVVYGYGTLVDSNPRTICFADVVYLPTENQNEMSKFTTTVLNLPEFPITGAYIDIDNSEYLEIKEILLDYKPNATLVGGHTVSADDTGIKILSYIIEDGDIIVEHAIVTLHNTCAGSPTHYRASTASDFSGANWTTYSTSPLFTILVEGFNRIYLQVKNATTDSEVEYRDIVYVPHTYMQDIDNLRTSNANLTMFNSLDATDDASYDKKDVVSLTSIGWAAKKALWNATFGWPPVGNVYTGTFDGAGFIISNLMINRPLEDNVGLFAKVTGEIRNLGLLNFSVIGKDNVGCLTGVNSTFITNCYSTGSVTGNNNVGGLVGQNEIGGD
jgi:hypothetical protein